MFLPILLLPLLSALAQDLTFDSNESDNSLLKIIFPSSLSAFAGLDGLPHTQALFGAATVGVDQKKLVGQLVYVTPGVLNGCDEYAERVPVVAGGEKTIFLVDRGSCDFVQKVRTAQKNGAVAVVIADNVCQCSRMRAFDPVKDAVLAEKCKVLGLKAKLEQRIPMTEDCEPSLPYMADDSSGADINIPSFIISYLDAQPLKDCYASATESSEVLVLGEAFKCAKGAKIITSLEWDLPSPDNVVSWSLWSSSDSEAVFKRSFAETAKKLAKTNSVKFQPRYFFWDGIQWGCNVDESCFTQCTTGGYYCNPAPSRDLFVGVSGRDVVEENLRELCVWEQALTLTDESVWWDYVTVFATMCHPGPVPDPNSFNLACSERAQLKVPKLNAATTRACVEKSWNDHKEKGKNVKLEAELKARAEKKILQLPTVTIKDVLLRGGVTTITILSSICSGFQPDSAPAICACVNRASSTNVIDCINSACAADEKLCSKDDTCYAKDIWSTKCGDSCVQATDKYCASLGMCVPTGTKCPACSRSTPTYCSILQKCVEGPLACVPEPLILPDNVSGGTSALGTFMITVMVVCIAGCFGWTWWRRQKAKLHEDVRAILATYMPLEENGEVGGLENEDFSRPSLSAKRSARVVNENLASDLGRNSVEGKDAVNYI